MVSTLPNNVWEKIKTEYGKFINYCLMNFGLITKTILLVTVINSHNGLVQPF